MTNEEKLLNSTLTTIVSNLRESEVSQKLFIGSSIDIKKILALAQYPALNCTANL